MAPIDILIVDDSAVMRKMVLRTLKLTGLNLGRILEAPDGAQGLQIAMTEAVDLVLTDLNMPVMSGEEMIDRIRQREELANLGIVVISTEGSATRVGRLAEKGADYVRKPFTPEELGDTICQMLGVSCDDRFGNESEPCSAADF